MPLTDAEQKELVELKALYGQLQAEKSGKSRPNLSEMNFTPDSNVESERIPGMGETIARGAIDTLPVAGAMAGGIIGGTAAGVPSLGMGAPGGALVGSTVGGALGASAKDAANKMFFADAAPQTVSENLQNVAGGAVMGAAQEMGGQIIGAAAPVVAGVARNLVGKPAAAIGQALKTFADDMSVATVGQTPKRMVDFGLGKTRKLGEYLMKVGITNRPALLSTVAREAEAIRKTTGKALDRAYEAAGEEGIAVHVTREGLIKGLTEKAAERYTRDGLGLPPEIEKQIADNVMKSIPDELAIAVSPKQVWNLAKQWEKAAGSWRRNLADAAADSKAAVLDDMADGAREVLSAVASNSSHPSAQMIPTLSHHYSLLREASKGLEKEVARTRTKTNLFSLEGLKRVYSATAASQPVRGAATGIINMTGERLLSLGAKLGRFQPVLSEAAKRGPAALAAAHFTLQQQNEEYRKKIQALSEEKK